MAVSNRRLLIVLVALGASGWLGVGGLALFLGNSVELPTSVGIAGDMFGGASALFTGFGSLGIVYILNRDREVRQADLRDRHDALEREKQFRREEFRPFVSVGATDAVVADASWQNGHYRLVIDCDLEFVNAAATPALNLVAQAVLEFDGVESRGSLKVDDSPLHTGASDAPVRKSNSRFTFEDEAAKSIVRAIATGGNLSMRVSAEYTSVSAVAWVSEVSYRFSCDDKQGREDLDVTLNPNAEGIGGQVAGDDNVDLQATSVLGSWTHGPKRSPGD